MTRREFMQELRGRLERLSRDEREAALAFYEEYFDEAGPNREQEVLRELGSPASVASRILAEHAVKEAREAPYNPRKGASAVWSVFLAILAAPFTIPMVIVIIALMIAVMAAVIGVGAAAVGLFIGGVALFVGGFMGLFATPSTALIFFGAAFVLWGIGKIIFVIIGAVMSLLGQLMSWLFGRSKGDYRGK